MGRKKAIMKRIASSALAGAMLMTTLPAALAAEVQGAVYVSPDGSDSGDGSIDAPFATLTAARDKVREMNADMSGDIYVYIMPGTYYAEETLNLGVEDSASNGYNIIYTAYDAENKPVISGGRDITTGWELHDSELNIYKHTGIDWEFRQLYTDGERAVRSRYPDMTDEVTGGPYLRTGYDSGSYPLTIPAEETAVVANGVNEGSAELIWVSSWSQFRARIDNITSNKIYFKSPDDTFAWDHHTQGNTPHYFENAYAFLSTGGEWYLDTDEDTLYYIPREGEVMNSTTIIAPVLETIINIEGESEDEKVSGITFSNISFLHTTWLAPNDYGYCSVQGGFRYQYISGGTTSEIRNTARYAAPASMMQLKYTSGITLCGNDFSYSGSWGVMGYEGTDHTLIDYNTFRQNAGGGVALGLAGDRWDDDEGSSDYHDMDGQSVYDTITNNTVDTVGCDYKDMVGIGAMLPEYLTVAHNEVGNLPYTGINIGWNWSDADHGMTDNQVYQNYIHNVCMLLQDGGGIYTLGRMDGDSNFYYNYITDIEMSEWAPYDNLMGIYFDNGSCYKKAQENVFDNTVYAFQASNPPNHDNIFESNYYNCPKGISSLASGNTAILNRPFTADDVPDKAREIIDCAGVGTEDLPAPAASYYNLALGKTVTASEELSGYEAALAVDGDASTRWAQPFTAGGQTSTDPVWLEVDLGGEYAVGEIVVSFQYGNRCRYSLEYSADGETWETYADRLSDSASSESVVYEQKDDVTARYIRLTMTSDGWGSSVYELYVYAADDTELPANSRVSPTSAEFYKAANLRADINITTVLNGSTLSEIRNGDEVLTENVDYIKHWNTVTVYADYLEQFTDEVTLAFVFSEGENAETVITITEDENLVNAALGKPITSTSESKPIAYAVDGDVTTRWAQEEGNPSLEPVIVIDLEQSFDISYISIMFELESNYQYTIETSADGETWETYADKWDTKTTEQTVTERGAQTARYVRFKLKNDQWGASVYEFYVMATAAVEEQELTEFFEDFDTTGTTAEVITAQSGGWYYGTYDDNTDYALYVESYDDIDNSSNVLRLAATNWWNSIYAGLYFADNAEYKGYSRESAEALLSDDLTLEFKMNFEVPDPEQAGPYKVQIRNSSGNTIAELSTPWRDNNQDGVTDKLRISNGSETFVLADPIDNYNDNTSWYNVKLEFDFSESAFRVSLNDIVFTTDTYGEWIPSVYTLDGNMIGEMFFEIYSGAWWQSLFIDDIRITSGIDADNALLDIFTLNSYSVTDGKLTANVTQSADIDGAVIAAVYENGVMTAVKIDENSSAGEREYTFDISDETGAVLKVFAWDIEACKPLANVLVKEL